MVVEPLLVERQEQSLRLLTVEQQEQSLGLLWEEQQEQSVGLLCGKQQEEQSLGPPWEEPLQACSLQGALWVVQPEPWLQGPVEQPELWLLQLLLLLLCVLWPQPWLQGQGEQQQPWLVVVGVVAHCGCCCCCCCWSWPVQVPQRSQSSKSGWDCLGRFQGGTSSSWELLLPVPLALGPSGALDCAGATAFACALALAFALALALFLALGVPAACIKS